MISSDRKEVLNALENWMEYGEFLITNATIYAPETIETFITALEEDGDYADVVATAKAHFKEVFGS